METHPTTPGIEPEDEYRLLKTIHQLSSEAVAVIRPNGRLVFANAAYTELFGPVPSTPSGSEAQSSAEDRPVWFPLVALPPGQQGWQGEWNLADQHGRQRHFHVHLDVVPDDGGAYYIAALFHDITADLQAREELRLNEARYRGLVESQHDLVVRIDLDGCILYANDACCRAFGAPRDHILGRSGKSLIFGDDDTQVAEDLAHLSSTTDHTYFERRATTVQGPRWFGWEAYRIAGSQGDASEIQCVGRDITEHKEMETALRNSNARGRAMMRAMPDTIFIMTRDGIFVDFHTPDSTGLMASLSTFLGRRVEEVLPHEASDIIVRAGQRAFETGEPQLIEFAQADEGIRHYEARLVAMDEDNLLTVVRNITERKKAEESLRNALSRERELSGLKTRFVSMASHEFRTPLSTILSSVELIELYSDRLTEEKRQRYFRQIRTAASHISDLLQDILLVGKMESGKVDFSPVPMQLSSVCAAVIEEAQCGIGKAHNLEFTPLPGCDEAWVDPKLLRHILMNLISNAIAYSPAGSTVLLRLECEDDTATFSVTDQGIGIPPEDQPHIHETFYRARNVGNIPGTGLGLVIVQQAVNLHRGTLSFTSTVGQGTTFVVTIPMRLDPDSLDEDDLGMD